MAELEPDLGVGNGAPAPHEPIPTPRAGSSGGPKEQRGGAHVQAFIGRETLHSSCYVQGGGGHLFSQPPPGAPKLGYTGRLSPSRAWLAPRVPWLRPVTGALAARPGVQKILFAEHAVMTPQSLVSDGKENRPPPIGRTKNTCSIGSGLGGGRVRAARRPRGRPWGIFGWSNELFGIAALGAAGAPGPCRAKPGIFFP